MSQKVAIIGAGISGIMQAYYLSQNNENVVTLYDGSKFIPSCSDSSTATICLRGVRRGVSPLGDKLIDSYEEFERFYSNNQSTLKGIYQGIDYHLASKNDENFKKRFSKTYLINEFPYQGFLKYSDNLIFKSEKCYFINFKKFKKCILNKKVEILDEYITNISCEGSKVNLQTNTMAEKKYDKVVICTNSFPENFNIKLNDNFKSYSRKIKKVRGSYLEVKLTSDIIKKLGDQSFSLKINKSTLLYRVEEGVMQIGSTSTSENDLYLESSSELIKMKEKFEIETNFPLPKSDKFYLKTGVRIKGAKRLPYWGEVAPNIYTSIGFYKNGYSFAFLAAKELACKINEK